MDFFRANSDFFKGRVLRDVIYFLMLVALAMALINPVMILLPAVFMAVISFVVGICCYETGYVTTARSVCQNE